MTAMLDWRRVGLLGLLASATVDHWTLTVAGLHVKPEHVVCLGLLIVAAFSSPWTSRLRGERRLTGARALFLSMLVYLVALLTASLLNAPDKTAALRHTALVALVASAGPLVYWLADTPSRLRFAVRLMIGLGVLEAGLIFLVLGADLLGASFGIQPGLGGLPVPFGTLWEANILGSYLAAAGMLLTVMLVGRWKRRQQYLAATGLALLLAALALSLARTAWVGFVVGAGVGVGCWVSGVGRRRSGAGKVRGLFLIGLAGLAALLFLLGPGSALFPRTVGSVFARVDPRFFSLAGDPSLNHRADTARLALDGILAHPLIGNGAGSYGDAHPATGNLEGWISNLELHLLYDSGVIGAGALLVGLGMLGRGAWRMLRRPSVSPEEDLRVEVIALVGALVALLTAFQATEGTWLAFSWVYVGLLARAVEPMAPLQAGRGS
ncbi:MAG: hypothetical protein ACR2M0_11825 [Chloroflexia bacterium]